MIELRNEFGRKILNFVKNGNYVVKITKIKQEVWTPTQLHSLHTDVFLQTGPRNIISLICSPMYTP